MSNSKLFHCGKGKLFFSFIVERPEPAASLASGENYLSYCGREVLLDLGLLGKISYFIVLETFSFYDLSA